MGNFAALVGCPSKEAAQSDNLWSQYWDKNFSDNNGWGPVWLSKYCIGGFWLACFSSEDEIQIVRNYDGETMPEFVGYFTDVKKAVERLERRKISILSLVPEPLRATYLDLYDDWVKVFQTQFGRGVFLDCDDLFGMIGQEEGSTALREHVRLIETLETEESEVDIIDFGLTGLIGVGEISQHQAEFSTAERAVDQWRFSLTGDPAIELSEWPPTPKSDEVEFAKTLFLEMKPKASPKKSWWKFWL